jgi:hypothetical protein
MRFYAQSLWSDLKAPKHKKIVAARAQTVTWITVAPEAPLYPSKMDAPGQRPLGSGTLAVGREAAA